MKIRLIPYVFENGKIKYVLIRQNKDKENSWVFPEIEQKNKNVNGFIEFYNEMLRISNFSHIKFNPFYEFTCVISKENKEKKDKKQSNINKKVKKNKNNTQKEIIKYFLGRVDNKVRKKSIKKGILFRMYDYNEARKILNHPQLIQALDEANNILFKK